MEQYSRRFIEELEKHIDPTIIEFFEKKRNLLKFPCNSMTELIDETLMNYLEGKTSREDLIPVINKIKKSRLQKRARWYKSYITDIETMTLDDPKHPSLPSSIWHALSQLTSMSIFLGIKNWTKLLKNTKNVRLSGKMMPTAC